MTPFFYPVWRRGLHVLLLIALQSLSYGQEKAAEVGVLELLVNGRPVKISSDQSIRLPASQDSVAFTYGLLGHSGSDTVRMRFKLAGYDADWRQSQGQMRLLIGFLDEQGSEVGRNDYPASGQSLGWTGSFETSLWSHRHEEIIVPPGAHSFWIVMTSAGGPNVLGAYAVSHLVVRTKVDTNGGTRELMRSPFDDGGTENNLSRTPPGWMRDGVRTRMAFMVKIGSEPSRAALAIVDNDIGGHVQWNTLKDQSPAVSPGEHLVIEWDEMYSVGKGTPAQVSYENLAPGNYRFYVHQLTIMGLPTGKIYALSVEIPFSFWKTPWFWVALTTVVLALALGSWRYREWRQLEAENTRLGQQQALERERFRIAQDIHDDLGARVTQISLASAMSERKAADPEVAREGFRNITQMARELVTSLYDTIWVVNPENDSLEAVGHYLCQMANQLVSQAGLPCRLEVPELPSGIPVSSHQRHNMSMAVKEAIHNAIKHAAATQVHLKIELTDSELMITIRDDGAGFDPAEAKRGSGLDNIHARLREIGGQADLSSAPHQETIVRLRLPLSVLNTVPTCGDTGSTTKDPASKLRAKSSNRF